MSNINLITTIKGSLLEGFFPQGWDLEKIDKCCSYKPERIIKREKWWHDSFNPVKCESFEDFNTFMGHEIALEIKKSKDEGRNIVFILPVGPMGMYRWVVYFIKKWNIDCSHVHGFNMDEWSDTQGNTLPKANQGSFQYAMEHAFYDPLEKSTVPEKQRHFATKDALPEYRDQIFELQDKGAKLVVVYGVGRVFHIAFWEPHFASEFSSVDEWKSQTHRIAAKLHPLTANTIGPGLFLKADYAIGGADGTLGRGMLWQGMSLCVTLKYGPDIWLPSSFMPTLPGVLFFAKELAGPLEPELN